MAERLVIDPVTRIEGHLRIETQMGDDGAVADAWVSGTMVRGVERALVGRDPREAWAMAQRACGVCTLVHAMASVRAVEDALGIAVPPAATVLRNLMVAQQHVHDHVMHFYHLHGFDWVDAAATLNADPAETARLQQAISPRPAATAAYFATVQDQLRTILESDRLSLFANGWWGHPAYRLSPEMDLLLMAHYFEALDWQSGVTVIQTILGGKNPHPNLVVGGLPLPIDLSSAEALNQERLDRIQASIEDMVQFVDQVYVPDVLAMLAAYPELAERGEGVGSFLTWGEFPTTDIAQPESYLVPRALILDRDLADVQQPDPRDLDAVRESVARSWYGDGAAGGDHPWRGATELVYSGPTPPYGHLDVDGRYSWLKAPRWRGRPMEVGPLARVLVMYAADRPDVRSQVDVALAGLGLPFEALYSTLGRTLARAIETRTFAHHMRAMYKTLDGLIQSGQTDSFNDARWDPATWPRQARGFGFLEAPRGALGHWVTVDHDRIAGYQIIAPTTWNASPRDHDGQPGPYEAAVRGLPVARPEQPLEVLRAIHSFDPCLACAVH